jgi:Tfp pilus assembly protein PilO
VRPLQAREKLILWVILMLLAVGGFYNFVYTPKTKEIAALKLQLKPKQEELKRVQAQAARKDELERQLAELQIQVRAVEEKLPSSREIPVLLVQLEKLAGQVGVDLTLIKPGLGQTAPGGQQPARPGAAPAGAAAAQAAGLQAFALDLNAEGTFDMVENFLRGIENFPRFIAMSSMGMTPIPQRAGEPVRGTKLAVRVTANAYYVPGSGAGR